MKSLQKEWHPATKPIKKSLPHSGQAGRRYGKFYFNCRALLVWIVTVYHCHLDFFQVLTTISAELFL
jgi:hypothetical protein